MIRPRVGKANDGQIMSIELINGMIARTEYAADLLRQYKLVAGNAMYVEPHFDGTRVSYNQPVKGGTTRPLPLGGSIKFPSPTNGIFNIQYLLDNYKPGSPAHSDQEYFQPFIDGVYIDMQSLIDQYGVNFYIRGNMIGVSGQMSGFNPDYTYSLYNLFGTPDPGGFSNISSSSPPMTLQLVGYYYGEPPFVPPLERFPTSITFELITY
ncbi:hypothetical protein EBZ39_07720 [bacterium]|nr:hypothetical protein [bacterium]